jgi:hypothetical protein
MYMIGNRTARAYNWRVFSSPFGATGASIPVIYCPWCGVELGEWSKLQQSQPIKRARAKRAS